jgi:hypothetical protein
LGGRKETADYNVADSGLYAGGHSASDGPSGAKSDHAKGRGSQNWGQKDACGGTSGTHDQREEI